MKLKWFLKGLCIFWLTLLPISFSSAYSYIQDFNIPDTFVKWNTAYTILNNFNFSTFYQNTALNHILFSESNLSSNWRNRLHSFLAFYDWKLYLYADYVHDWSRSYVYQWFPTQFCLATAWSGQSVCVPSGRSCPKNTNIDVFYNAWKLTHWSYYWYWDFSSTYQVRTYCVSDDIYDYCFSVSASSYDCWNYLTWSLNVPWTSVEQLQSFNWSSSPFSNSVAPTPDSDIIYIWDWITWTNKEYIEAFEERWYYKGLCYSDFYSWNLIDSNTQISDLFIGDLDDSVYYWHSVFDFYESENTSLSTHSRSQSRYVLTKYTYERDNLTPYIWKEKGTRNIMFNIYNNHFNDNFSWIDYRTYCDMVVNWYNPWETFDWDVSQGMKDYVKRLEEEKSFILSWADVDFSWSKDLLGIFNWLYSRFKNAFPIDPNLSNKTTWILPSYIILGFFLFLVLYVLKR